MRDAFQKMKPDREKMARILADAQRTRVDRAEGYRERALALFPHVCARCGRAFSGKALRELTVHHKDHNHGNNPPDGSNWELLCLYCHDDEHQDPEQRDPSDPTTRSAVSDGVEATLFDNPFQGLKEMIEDGEEADSE